MNRQQFIDYIFSEEIRPEFHDCHASPEDGCEGCQIIAQILRQG